MNVLLVEDERDCAQVLEAMISREEHGESRVESVADLASALQRVGQEKFDIVVLDLNLPDCRGLDTLNRLHAQVPDLPIVVVSARGDEKTIGEATHRGAQEYLVKAQFSPDAFTRAMHYAVELKHAEQEMSREHALLSALLDGIPDFIYFKDTESRVTLINKALAARFGLGHPKEAIGKTDSDFFAMEHAAHARSDEMEVMRTGRPVADKREKETWPDGRETWVSTTKTPLHDEKGEIVGTCGISRDITDRVQAENDLRESEEKYRGLVECLSEGLWVIDKDAVTTFVNPRMGEMLGYAPDEMLGKHLFSFMDEKDAEICKGDLERRTRGITEEQDCEFLRKDGSRVYAIMHTAPLTDKSGNYAGAIAGVIDVTERKRGEEERRKLEAQLQQAHKMESLGILAGGIAHDFNNLLMGVMGNADLALSDIPSASPSRERIRAIQEAAKRAAELCNQLLAYSGKGRFLNEVFDLSTLVEEISHLLEVSISKSAVLKYNLPKPLPPIEGDPTQVRQIVMNLITNASDALMEKSGTISITTGAMECDRFYLAGTFAGQDLSEGMYVYVEVADTGCGMDQETKSKIFDPFFSTKFAGRGLGLSAVLGIVQGHHGGIKVYSELGRGSTFRVLFPVSGKFLEKPAKPFPPAEQWRGSGTVLLVDDEETVRAVGKLMLQRIGFDVLTASDGREAILVFREHADSIRLVLLDLTMPHLGGVETLTELQKTRSDVPVILSSGYTEENTSDSLGSSRPAGFIQKPYQLETLRSKLQEVLRE